MLILREIMKLVINREYKYFLVSIPTIASESKRIEEDTKEGRGEAFSSRAIS